MRTTDGRFRDVRYEFSPKFQRKMIESCKQHNQFTWDEFAGQLDVSEFTLRYSWRNGESTLPCSIVEILSRLSPEPIKDDVKSAMLKIKNPFWGQQFGGLRSSLKSSLPNTDSVDFAEFYGILLGDGCVYSNLNTFCVSSDGLLDAPYVTDYVAPLISKLFGRQPAIYYPKSERSIKCVFNGRQVMMFLVEFGFPPGKKSLGKAVIPPKFFENSDFLASCIRGLVDTDGSLCPHPNSKIMLNLTAKIPTLWKDCLRAFTDLGLAPSSSRGQIYLYGREKVEKYFEKVGSSNVKHILKYVTYKNAGKVPVTSQLIEKFKGKYKFNCALPFNGPVV